MTISLQAQLQSHYPHHHRRHVIAPNTPWVIWIDDHNDQDVSPEFCHLAVRGGPKTTDPFRLVLYNPPLNREVLDLCGPHDPHVKPGLGSGTLSLALTIHDAPFVRQLARAIKGLIGRGQHYDNRNWRWICRRTAAALIQFAQHLQAFKRSQRVKQLSLGSGGRE